MLSLPAQVCKDEGEAMGEGSDTALHIFCHTVENNTNSNQTVLSGFPFSLLSSFQQGTQLLVLGPQLSLLPLCLVPLRLQLLELVQISAML